MIKQIIYCRPDSISRVADARIQVESVINPILREMAIRYNESIGKFVPPCIQPYNKGNHTKNIHSKGGSSGVCYLTTACVNARGLPDNCLELTTLRAFRDKVLMSSSVGREVIREYYQVAPQIVERVNALDNSQRVWNKAYLDIQRTVNLVREGKFNEAFENYKRMTIFLKEKHLD